LLFFLSDQETDPFCCTEHKTFLLSGAKMI
jgi:hypothetical protein